MDRRAYAHTFPFTLSLWRDWDDRDGVHIGFQTEGEARAYATLRPEPLIDLVRKDHGVIAGRRLVPSGPWMDPRDDFPYEPVG